MKRARVAVRAASSLVLKIQFVGTLVRSWRHDVAECVAVRAVFMTDCTEHVTFIFSENCMSVAGYTSIVLISLFRTSEFRNV